MSDQYFFLNNGTAKLHCASWQVLESAPWVLLLNGYGRPISDFKGLVRSLNSQQINCLSLDVRGSGLTKAGEEFDLSDILKDIHLLINHVGIRKLSVLGISMGGLLAQALYFSDGQAKSFEIESLLLVSTCSDSKWLTADAPVYGLPFQETVAGLSKYFSPSFAAKNIKLVEAMAKDILKSAGMNTKGKNQQSKAIRQLEFTERLSEISVPVSLIHGKDDKIISIDAATEAAGLIKTSRLIQYDNVGHLLIAECAKRFYGDVVDIIRSLK